MMMRLRVAAVLAAIGSVVLGGWEYVRYNTDTGEFLPPGIVWPGVNDPGTPGGETPTYSGGALLYARANATKEFAVAGENYRLAFPVESIDSEGAFDGDTFVVPEAGYYMVAVDVPFSTPYLSAWPSWDYSDYVPTLDVGVWQGEAQGYEVNSSGGELKMGALTGGIKEGVVSFQRVFSLAANDRITVRARVDRGPAYEFAAMTAPVINAGGVSIAPSLLVVQLTGESMTEASDAVAGFHMGASATFSSSTAASVPVSSELFDTGDDLSSGGVFTVPASGYYRMILSSTFSPSGAETYRIAYGQIKTSVAAKWSGSEAYCLRPGISTTYCGQERSTISLDAVLDLTAADTVTAYGEVSTTGHDMAMLNGLVYFYEIPVATRVDPDPVEPEHVFVSGYRSADTTFAGTPSVVSWTEVSDTEGDFDGSTFTCPAAGAYELCVSAPVRVTATSLSSAVGYLSLTHNDVNIESYPLMLQKQTTAAQKRGTADGTITFRAIVVLEENDTLEFTADLPNGAEIACSDYTSARPYFWLRGATGPASE